MMKNLVNSIKKFYDVEILDEKNMTIYSHFFLRDTNELYPINVKEVGDGEYIIHDAAFIIHFLDENDLIIDRDNVLKLTNDYENLIFAESGVICYKTNKKTFAFDLAKYIQIITKITN